MTKPEKLNIAWGYSSDGRALEWHSRGQRFDPAYLHQEIKNEKGFKSNDLKPFSCFSYFLSTFPFSSTIGFHPRKVEFEWNGKFSLLCLFECQYLFLISV